MRCGAPSLEALAAVGCNPFEAKRTRRHGRVSIRPTSHGAKRTPRQTGRVRPSRDITVCLLESAATAIQLSARAVRSAGWKIRPFTDPVAFLSYVKTDRPEVAIIAHRGSRMIGVKIAHRLRDVSPYSSVIMSLQPCLAAARSLLSGSNLISLIRERCIADRNGFVQPDGGNA
jgi:hypothetical protein